MTRSRSSAARASHNWCWWQPCKPPSAKSQVLMKQHAEFGVLVLRARDGKDGPTSSPILGNLMPLLPRKGALAIAAVIDIALNARGRPVAAKSPATRHRLPPRHLEPVLQALVRHGILKGTRGPRGGYELAREQRRITADDILRAAGTAEDMDGAPAAGSTLLNKVVMPALGQAEDAFSAALARINVEDLAHSAAALRKSAGEG